MDLRRRTLLVVALSFAGIAVALYFALSSTVLKSLADYEKADASTARDRLVSAYNSRSQEFQKQAQDLADEYAVQDYMQRRDLGRLANGCPSTEYQNKGLTLAVLVNSSGRAVAGFYDPLASWGSKDWTEAIRAQLKGKGWPDFSAYSASDASAMTGVLSLPGAELQVAAAPIGDHSGYVFIGRPLDKAALFNAPAALGIEHVEAHWLSEKNLPWDFKRFRFNKEASFDKSEVLSNTVISGYFKLPSVGGNDSLVVRSDVMRRVAQSGRKFAMGALIVLVVSVLVCGWVLWVILDRQVLSRLGQLTQGVATVGAKADPSLRVKLVGDDEVAKLSMSINHMLGDLERAQGQIKESEQRFSALSGASFEAILIHDSTRVVEVNQALLELFGYRREEIIGLELDKLSPRWGTESIWVRAGNAGDEPFEANGVTKSGSTVPLEVRSRSMPYRGQDMMVAAMRDITERRKAEAALKESEERYRRLVDLAQEGIVSNDANEVITFCNPTFASVLGYTPHQLVGRSLIELCVAPSAERMLQEATKRRSGLSGTYEVELYTRDNRVRAFHLTARPMFDEGGTYEGSLGVFTDITERKQTEQAWLAAQKAESLGVLAGGIAHDFNNLLVGIIGNVSLALDTLPPASPVLKYLSEVDRSAQRASELVAQMLAYSGKGRLALRKVDVNNVIEETIRLMGTSVPKHVQLELDLGRPLSTVDADEGLLRQMVTSFILNSVEAIKLDNGNIRINTGMVKMDAEALRSIAPSSELVAGEYVFISVTDNGMGMDHGVREKVFDPFFSTKFAGRGLGLAAVQGIVKRHRGAIHVESAPGQGASFRVILPVSGTLSRAPEQEKAPQPLLEEGPEAPGPRAGTSTNGHKGHNGNNGHNGHNGNQKLEVAPDGGEAAAVLEGVRGSVNGKAALEPEQSKSEPSALPCVLVIAQEQTVRQVTRRILEQHGYSVELATDGATGVREYSKAPARYDLVLLDLDLKDMSGADAYSAIKRANADVHAVLITGELDTSMGEGVDQRGAVVLRKPFSPAQLLHEMEALV